VDKEFTPSKQAFIIKMIWLACPVLLVMAFDSHGLLPEKHREIDLVLLVGVTVGIARSVWLNGMKIRFRRQCLMITDFFGRERDFAWKLISKPLIETNIRWFLPSSQIFSFNCREGGEIKYRLSELSDDDCERVLVLLRLNFPGIEEIGH